MSRLLVNGTYLCFALAYENKALCNIGRGILIHAMSTILKKQPPTQDHHQQQHSSHGGKSSLRFAKLQVNVNDDEDDDSNNNANNNNNNKESDNEMIPAVVVQGVRVLECDYCGNPNLTRKLQCSACHASCYCSKEHQKKDWKRHKPLCLRYRSENP